MPRHTALLPYFLVPLRCPASQGTFCELAVWSSSDPHSLLGDRDWEGEEQKDVVEGVRK